MQFWAEKILFMLTLQLKIFHRLHVNASPFTRNILTKQFKLRENKFAWNKFASVVYLESPAG